MPKSRLEYSLGNLGRLASGRLTFGWLTTNIFIFLIPFHKLCCFCVFCRKMSKIAGKLKRAISFRSTRSSLSRASTDMEVDPLSPAVGAPSRSALVERNVLLQEKQLKLRDDREKNIYKKQKDRDFILTPSFSPQLWTPNLNHFQGHRMGGCMGNR